ncbi:MAG: hypothetical protein ABIK49_04140 [candidate division WOR-3 bacterium]
MITKPTCARFLMVITLTVLISALLLSCGTTNGKEGKETTAPAASPDSVKLKGTFTITNDGLTVNFYDEKDNLRATIEIDSAHIGLAFKPESLNIPLGEDERAPKGSLIITKDRFALSLYDEKTKGTAFLTLTSDGLQLVVYDSLGKPVWGK